MRVLLCGYHEAGYRALRTPVARGHDVIVATHPAPPGTPSVADYARSLTASAGAADCCGAVPAPDRTYAVRTSAGIER